jgi:hypothetical protein
MAFNAEKFRAGLDRNKIKKVEGELESVQNPVMLPDPLSPQARTFIKKHNVKIVRGQGTDQEQEYDIHGNEWKVLELAKLFNYDSYVMAILDDNADDIINKSDPVTIILALEQINLLRGLLDAINRTNERTLG